VFVLVFVLVFEVDGGGVVCGDDVGSGEGLGLALGLALELGLDPLSPLPL